MAAPSTEGFNKDPEVYEAPGIDRESMLAYRWAMGCKEVRMGVRVKPTILQIYLPDDWLLPDDHEPAPSTRHGKETKAPRSGPPANAGSAATSRPGVTERSQKPTPQEGETEAGKADGNEHSNSPVPGGKQSDGSTGAGSNCAFDTSSNSSKGSACSKEAAGSKDTTKDSRNVIQISSCITGDGSATPGGTTISLNSSINANAEPSKRVPTAEEQATAALSAMLGLGKPKVNVAPTPPPRTAPWRPPRSGLNPNAAEFWPMGDGYASSSTWPPPMDAPQVPPAEKESDEIPEEMSCLLGGSLLDEICGGSAPGDAGPPTRPRDSGAEASTGQKKTTTI